MIRWSDECDGGLLHHHPEPPLLEVAAAVVEEQVVVGQALHGIQQLPELGTKLGGEEGGNFDPLLLQLSGDTHVDARTVERCGLSDSLPAHMSPGATTRDLAQRLQHQPVHLFVRHTLGHLTDLSS